MSITNQVRRGVSQWALPGVSATALMAVASVAHAEAAAPADASAESPGVLSEIVVTATRRGEQSLIDVPQAVSAYSGDTLQKFNVQSLQDLTKIDPSLVVENQSSTQQRIVIRGIASTTTQTAGLYLDEAPLLGGYNGNLAGDGSPGLRIHDVDHVEVLKGPQGTLFGSGSMSGTLRVLTRGPRLNGTEGFFEASYAGVENGNPYYDSDFAFSTPIVEDKLGVRFVGWTEQGGGYIDKFAGDGVRHPNVSNRHLYGGRLSALWDVTDRLTLQVGANYQNVAIDGPEYSTSRVGEIGAGFRAPPPGFGRWVNYDYTAEALRDKFELYSAVANYDLGFGNIIASATDGRRKLNQTSDTTGLACLAGLCPPTSRPSAFISNQDYHYDVGEIRFTSKFSGPFQVVAGGYFQHDTRPFVGVALQADPNSGVPLCASYFDCRAKGLIDVSTSGPAGPFGDYVIFANADSFKTTQYAFYAQADYKLTDQLTLTAGGRYFKARLTDNAITTFFPDDTFVPFSGTPIHATQSKPTYNVALLYQPTHDWSVYGRVASGFRIGGVNVSAGQAAAAGVILPSTYAPDSLTDYELGTKLYLLDRKVYLDASIYHIDWKGQQLGALAAGIYAYQLNAGKTTTNGAELSATFLPVDGLSISPSITYTEATLARDLPLDVQANGTPGSKGDTLPFVPKWSASLRGEYAHAVTDALTGYLQGNLTYRHRSMTGFRQTSAEQLAAGFAPGYDVKIPGYYLADTRVGVRTEKLDLNLYVRNLFNRYAVIDIAAATDTEAVTTAPPRTIGVQIQTRF